METKYVSVDEMLTYVGAYGPYQWILDAIFSVIMVPQTFQILIMYFAALSPAWKCATNSTVCISNETFANDDNKRCSMTRSDWEYTESYDFSVTTQFDLVCDDAWIISFTTAIFFVGWIFGALTLGWFADRYGRKTVYFPMTALLLVAGFVTAFSPNITTVLVLRFIAGFAVPGTGVQGIVLMSELVDGKHRAFAGLVIFMAFTLSLSLVGVKAYFIQQWKLLFIVCTVPYVFIFIFYPMVPESIRWLCLQGKILELNKIFAKIARWNKKQIPVDIAVATGENTDTHKANPLDLFKTMKVAISTLVQGYSWLVNGMVYYGLSLAADDLGGNLYVNYILVSVIEFPAIASAIYFCDKFGRKKTILPSLLIGSISCILVAFIPNTGDSKYARIVFGMAGKFFVSVSFNGIYTWSIELFPTETRGEGMGFLQIAARLGAATSPFIAKGLKMFHHSAPFITMGALGIIGFGVQFVLPETRGVAITETSNDIEMKRNPGQINNKVTPKHNGDFKIDD